MIQSGNEIPTTSFPFVSLRLSFDILEMRGSESVDFLHRISTNDLTILSVGSIRYTLLVSDKGRIIDTIWIIRRDDHLQLLLSEGTAERTIQWLNRYIIMEDIVLTDVSSQYSVTVFADMKTGTFKTEYFGYPVSLEITEHSSINDSISADVVRWRIMNGIPMIGHEIVEDYNPLELNLWNWISFTKGCYIGQEVIARLDTYNKIQRSLCRFSGERLIPLHGILCDHTGNDVGKITTVLSERNSVIGLAMLRSAAAVSGTVLKVKGTEESVTIMEVFRKV